ncbi:transposable element tc3 transposase [Lasius niger]|uniref:Transposable element tc3 transposase n=1 Tax=Lasius niger TaxID=67767 RepID=A0A0J7JUP5_LASNI|nr:transposable element tc3 transposase [Lasius niger]
MSRLLEVGMLICIFTAGIAPTNQGIEMLEDTPLRIPQQMWYQHDGVPHHGKQIFESWLTWLNLNYCNRWTGGGHVP